MAKAGKIIGKIGLGLLIAAVAAVAGGMVTLLALSTKTVVDIAKEEVKFHTVRFSYDNNIISTQAVVDGKTAVAPYLPSTVTDHNGYEYDFVGWTNDGENIVDPNAVTVMDDTNYAAMFKFSGYVTNGAIPTEWVGTYDIPENAQKICGVYIWQYTDAAGVEHVYCSNNYNQYKLAEDGVTWEPQTWSGLTNFLAKNIWQYNGNVYYSENLSHYKLAEDGVTWKPQTWTGLTSFNGEYVWQCGDNVYYSYNSDQYKLNVTENKWEKQTWKGLASFNGGYVWQCGDNVYYSYDYNQYKLADNGVTWERRTWEGLQNLYGTSVWQYNGNVYYSSLFNQYKLADDGITWKHQTWEEVTDLAAADVWQHNGNVYYSNGSKQYKLADNGITWQRIMYSAAGELDINANKIWNDNDGNTYYGGEYQLKDGKWVTLDWKINARYITNIPENLVQYTDADGVEHMYYLGGGTQYKFRDDRIIWESFNSGSYTYGRDVWLHNGNVYYSDDSIQYQLNDSERWVSYTWAGLTNFKGEYVWQHDGNVYYSDYTTQYKLADNGVTWEPCTWTGLTNFNGTDVFQVGDETYIKSNNKLYYLVGSEWQRVPAKQTILGKTDFCTISDESFFAYNNIKYVWQDIYYCPEAKIDNEYVNNHVLDIVD